MRRAQLVATKVAAVGVLCGVAAVALIVSRQGPAVLLNAKTDLDAPTFQDLAFIQQKGRHQSSLKAQNQKLKNQVSVLEQEVQTLSKDITAPRPAGRAVAARAAQDPTQSLHGMQKRMAWAKQAMRQPWTSQMLAKKRGLAHELDVTSPFYSTSRGDPMATTSLTSDSGDGNWIDALKPGDYWKDPYERPFLHSPYPHDPTSSLAHTVTGDYASPATWGEIYRNKETMDWCTENFAWFEDRIKCIRKMHGQGPILG